MRRSKLLLIAALFVSHQCLAQEARIIKLPELQQMMADNSKGIHVINFWATWCGPCIKELPYFENITATRSEDIKVTLVSLDLDLNPDPQKVQRFIELKKLRSAVVMLNESDPNSWIDKVDARWSGALPATIIINHRTGARIFVNKSLEEGQLEKLLEQSNKMN